MDLDWNGNISAAAEQNNNFPCYKFQSLDPFEDKKIFNNNNK